MRISDWAIEHPDKQIAVIIKDGRIINNYFVKFNLQFLNKDITIKSECLWTRFTIKLPNNTYIHCIKEQVADTFFRGRRFSAIFYESDIDNDVLARAICSLDTSSTVDYNEVLFKEFIPYS
jgi:hypothetical protein